MKEYLGPIGLLMCWFGIIIVIFNLKGLNIGIVNPTPLLFPYLLTLMAYPTPTMGLFLTLYLSWSQASVNSSTLLAWTGITLIVAGIASMIVGGRAAAKARETIRTTPTVIKETIKEREIVYIRCRYCGAKVPETEKECPKCGATL